MLSAWHPESAVIDLRPWDCYNMHSRNSKLKTTSSTSNTVASHLSVQASDFTEVLLFSLLQNIEPFSDTNCLNIFICKDSVDYIVCCFDYMESFRVGFGILLNSILSVSLKWPFMC